MKIWMNPTERFSLASAALLCSLCLPAIPEARANVVLGTPFNDNMVLQRDMPVPVWGTAAAGEQVTIEFAGQTNSVIADVSGKWRVTLNPLATSATPQIFKARAANTVTRTNVLVGEVWLCSGQSNMEGDMRRFEQTTFGSNPSYSYTTNIYEPELARTTPGVRLYRANTVSSDTRKNIWMECGPDATKRATVMGFSAVGYFFAKGLHETNGLSAAQDVPIGMIEAAVGGTMIETWTPPNGGNYQALIQPLAGFAMRGVLWYQGESNLTTPDQGANYDTKMATLIQAWRANWNQSVLPFYCVQLPRLSYVNYSTDVTSPQDLAWFRDLQNQVLLLPDTGIIITSDLVDTTDEIHPPNKWDVGQRLAMLALAKTYGQSNLVYSGPVYESMEHRGNDLVLTFDHVGSGLTSSGLKDFTVAGNDGRFVPATAVIESNKVVVSSYAWQPTAVRYGWTELTIASLFNQEGLPAGPFRTDNWSKPSQGKIVKANNSDALNLTTSWIGDVAPGPNDVAQWNYNAATGAVDLGADTSWSGISIVDPNGAVTISAGHTLSLAGGGIDMSGAKKNLFISSGLSLLPGHQVWNVASGRLLTLDTGAFTRSAGATLNAPGSGSIAAANIANDATGIVGPWFSFGTGNATKYASVSGGNVVSFTGTAAATAADVTDTSGLINYNVAAVGTLGAGASFNTLRYTGAAGSIYGDFKANGLMNSGSGALSIRGVPTIGDSKELVVNTANNDITLSGSVADNPSGASALVKQGSHRLTLASGANSYSGGSWINEGEVYYVASGGFGSGNVVVGNGAEITFRPGGATLANNTTIAGDAMNLSGASPVLSGHLSLSADARISTGNTANQNLTVNGDINLGAYTLTLNTASAASQAWAINGNISGTGGVLLKSGTSTTTTLTLSGSNTFSGLAAVSGSGALAIKNINALKNATLDTGGSGPQKITWTLAGVNTYNVGGLQGADDLAIGGNSLSIGANNANTVYAGNLSGAGNVIKVGTGTLMLTDANTYSGGTTISNGTLALSGAGKVISTGITNFGVLDVSGTSGGYHLTAGQTLTGNGSIVGPLTVDAGATLTVRGSSGMAGLGTVTVAGDLTLNGTTVLRLNKGGTSDGISASGTLLLGGSLNLNSVGASLAAGDQFQICSAGNSGTPNLTGSPGVDLYWDATLLNSAGIIKVVTNVTATAPSITVGLTNQTVQAGASATFNALASGTSPLVYTWSFDGVPVAMGTNLTSYTTNNLQLPGSVYTVSVQVTNVAGTAGSSCTLSVVALVDAPPIWTNLLGGVWASAANWSNGVVASGANATADFSQLNITTSPTVNLTSAQTIGNLTFGDVDTNSAAGWILTNNGTAGNTLTLAGTTPTVTVSELGAGKSVTINAVVAGTAGLNKSGSGTLVLSTGNTYTGGTTISNGTISITTDTCLGAAPGVATPGNLVLDGGILSVASAGSLTLNVNRGAVLGDNGGTITKLNTGRLTYSGIVTGSGALTANLAAGGGELAPGAGNTYSGGANVTGDSGATLIIGSSTGSPGSLTKGPFGTGPVTLNGPGIRSGNGSASTLGNDISLAGDTTFATTASEKSLTLSGPVTLVGGDRVLNVLIGTTVGTESLTISGAIGDDGNDYGLIKSGAGRLNLSGTNTYLGDTVVSNGTLRLTHSVCLSTNSAVWLRTGATLDLAFVGTNRINALYVDGQLMNAGIYGSAELPGKVTGTGYLSTVPTAEPVSGYDAWAQQITNRQTGYDQSATGDGYPNLLKYATGSSPTESDALAELQGTLAGGQFALLFNRNTNATDVIMTVEAAQNLSGGATWSGIATNTGGLWEGPANVTEIGMGSPVSVTVLDAAAATTNRFFRLRVTRP